MRVLVLGGTGFVGSCVVKYLRDLGHAVTVFHRGRTEADLPARVDHLHGDRQHLAGMRDTFRHMAPDVLLDMVPMSEQDARLAMDTFRGITGRVVAISSGDVYRAYDIFRRIDPGPPIPIPMAETAPLRQHLYPYRGLIEGEEEYEKILVERVVMGDAQLPGTVLRLAMVYGPGDPQHRLFPYLKRIDDQRAAILVEEGVANWRSSHIYVENAAAAIARATVDERAAGRTYNVAEPDALTEAEWISQIGQVGGWHGEIVVAPEPALLRHIVWKTRPGVDAPRVNTEQHWVLDSTRIRHELGYSEVVSRVDALRHTIAWQCDHPPEEINPAKFDYGAEDAALALIRQLRT